MLPQARPSSSTTAQTTPPQPQQVRFRQACDSCTAAKVRCDKARPACQRCLDNAQSCGYSASRRYGKRAKHPKTGLQQTQLSSPTKETSFAPPQSSTAEAECYIPSHYNDIAWENDDTNLTATESSPAFSTGNGLDLFGDLTSCVLPDLENANYVPLYDEWMKQPEFSWAAGASQHHGTISVNVPTLPVEQMPSDENGTTIIGTLSRSTSENFRHDIEHALECEARAINILRSLHYSPTLHSPEWKDSPSGERSNATVNRSAPAVHTMETLLFTNKAALSDLTQMLECRCAENQHVAFMHIAILQKVVFWYKVAVTAKYHSKTVELQPMKIQLGMLELDEGDYASLHRAALLRELHKAGSVIQAFEGQSATGEKPVCTKLLPWARLAIRTIGEELQQVIQQD